MSRFPLVVCFLMTLSGQLHAEEGKIWFVKKTLDTKFRSEGVAVGDFNGDGKQDIAAGFVWYEAPDWKMHVISPEVPSGRGAVLGSPLHFDPKGYSNSFCNFAEDVNGDGKTDLIVVDFPGTPTWWYENPGKSDQIWKKHLCTPVTNNESPQYLDIDGDGKRELIAAFSPNADKPDGPNRQMAIIRPVSDPFAPWTIHAISKKAVPGTKRYSHGLGVGDINLDDRQDVVTADGWWEAPAKEVGLWKFHPAEFGERGATGEGRASQMFVFDFDGDGDQDVLSSSPHAFGIWWHEQQDGKWIAHEIDRTFSQCHGVCFADMNGDGLPDFVTGKRWWAHGGRDPGGDQPAVFCWFELRRGPDGPHWIRHQFDHDSGPGTQFEVADVNGDGLLDVVTSNKKGVHYFQQARN